MVGRSVHDPVHGTIPVDPVEMAVIDTPAVQRLRFVKQLGFAEMAFPGATHSRLAHSLGAMHVAGCMFDEATRLLPLAAEQRSLLRLTLRLAVLLHDVGHPPLSHAAEAGMPALAELGLGALAPDGERRRARHEDYTLALMVASPLTALLQARLGPLGASPELLACLVAGAREVPRSVDPTLLACDGMTLLPLLQAIVAGELDADRMDYLRRDAQFVGVGYGQVDHVWLTANMVAVPGAMGWRLGLHPRAIWALENFLLARYHMFLAVYFHHTAVAFDTMLSAWFAEEGFTWPADPVRYLEHDDTTLWQILRASSSRWARDIVARRPLSMLGEVRLFGEAGDDEARARLEADAARLRAAGLTPIGARSDGALSRYARPGGREVPLVTLPDERGGDARPVDASTPLYRRFAQPVSVARLFCPPEERGRARALRAEADTALTCSPAQPGR